MRHTSWILLLPAAGSVLKAHDNLARNTAGAANVVRESEGCWRVVRDFFGEEEAIDCDVLGEGQKSFLALAMTRCHMKDRLSSIWQREETPQAVACQVFLERQAGGTEPHVGPGEFEAQDGLAIGQCKAALSDTAFLVFVEFFNHVDNICFFVQSSEWQERTENLIDLLGAASKHVVGQLEYARNQNTELLSQQQIALDKQHRLLQGSERLQTVIESGQETLRGSFQDMRIEVHEEARKVQDVLAEVFNMFHRVLEFQRFFAGQLWDFSSGFLYMALVFTTQHFTNTEATKAARVPAYLLWSLMLSGEVALNRLLRYCEAAVEGPAMELLDLLQRQGGARSLLWKWRLLCVVLVAWIWFRCWWNWKDPFQLYDQTLKNRLSCFQEDMHRTIRRELQIMASAQTVHSSPEDGSNSVWIRDDTPAPLPLPRCEDPPPETPGTPRPSNRTPTAIGPRRREPRLPSTQAVRQSPRRHGLQRGQRTQVRA